MEATEKEQEDISFYDPNLDESFDEEDDDTKDFDDSEYADNTIFTRQKRMSCVAHTLMLAVQHVNIKIIHVSCVSNILMSDVP